MPPPTDTKILHKYPAAPHPFVLMPPNGRRTIEAGRTLNLGLTLFGRTVGWLPLFLFALERMGRTGLGGRRVTASLVAVDGRLDGHRHPCLPPMSGRCGASRPSPSDVSCQAFLGSQQVGL